MVTRTRARAHSNTRRKRYTHLRNDLSAIFTTSSGEWEHSVVLGGLRYTALEGVESCLSQTFKSDMINNCYDVQTSVMRFWFPQKKLLFPQWVCFPRLCSHYQFPFPYCCAQFFHAFCWESKERLTCDPQRDTQGHGLSELKGGRSLSAASTLLLFTSPCNLFLILTLTHWDQRTVNEYFNIETQRRRTSHHSFGGKFRDFRSALFCKLAPARQSEQSRCQIRVKKWKQWPSINSATSEGEKRKRELDERS